MDSTHFPPTTQSAFCIAYFQRPDGSWFESDNEEVAIINKSCAFNYANGVRGSIASPIVKNNLFDANWSCYENFVEFDSWEVASFLEGAGVFFITAHGVPAMHCTSSMQEWILALPMVNVVAPDHLTWRQAAIGNVDAPYGAPPYNNGHPQITFALINSCESGVTDEFGMILYPFSIYNFNSVTNQAVWTWDGSIFQAQQEDIHSRLWPKLTAKMTIAQARQSLIADNMAIGAVPFMHIYRTGDPPHGQPIYSIDDIPVWGDDETRIHVVYTGTNLLPAQEWYY